MATKKAPASPPSSKKAPVNAKLPQSSALPNKKEAKPSVGASQTAAEVVGNAKGAAKGPKAKK